MFYCIASYRKVLLIVVALNGISPEIAGQGVLYLRVYSPRLRKLHPGRDLQQSYTSQMAQPLQVVLRLAIKLPHQLTHLLELPDRRVTHTLIQKAL